MTQHLPGNMMPCLIPMGVVGMEEISPRGVLIPNRGRNIIDEEDA